MALNPSNSSNLEQLALKGLAKSLKKGNEKSDQKCKESAEAVEKFAIGSDWSYANATTDGRRLSSCDVGEEGHVHPHPPANKGFTLAAVLAASADCECECRIGTKN